MPDEQYYLDYKTSILSDEPILVDVGGFEGDFTKSFFKKFPYAKSFIFEPVKISADNIRKYMGDLNVQIFQFGIGETLKWSDFYEVTGNGKECSSIYFRQNFVGNLQPKAIISLDMLYPTFFDHIDYLKIDVEGNEYNALKGAKNIIENKIAKYIQFEYGECYSLANVELNDVIKLLSTNYTVFHKDYGYVDDSFNLKDECVRNFFAEVKS